MTKDRINEYRAKLQKGQVVPVNWSKVAHDRYETVEELLHELEVETDQPQPILGLDWEEIEKAINRANNMSMSGVEAFSLLNRTLMKVRDALKERKRWVVMERRKDSDFIHLYGVDLSMLTVFKYISSFHSYKKDRAMLDAECDRRNEEVVKKKYYLDGSFIMRRDRDEWSLSFDCVPTDDIDTILDALNAKEGE